MLHILGRNGFSPSTSARFDGGDRAGGREIYTQGAFREMLRLERKRAARSQRRSILMLLQCGALDGKPGQSQASIKRAVGPLAGATRDTDIMGWYSTGQMMGVIFTEIGTSCEESATQTLLNKVGAALSRALSSEEMNGLSVAVHTLPEATDQPLAEEAIQFTLYRDLVGIGRLGDTPATGCGQVLGLDPVIG